ncbi:MAG: HPr kinase/phosphorylase, partial [Ignavibacteriales bacterium]|nr:HPr kinase/phosphorylase [Ignavibacteriales bacterium]
MTLENFKETRRESITVGYFFESTKDRLKMTSANGEVGFEKVIRDRSIHRPGLALAGYVELFTYDRVQVVGNTEVRYLRHLSLSERIHA